MEEVEEIHSKPKQFFCALKFMCLYYKFLKRPLHGFTILHALHLGTIAVLGSVLCWDAVEKLLEQNSAVDEESSLFVWIGVMSIVLLEITIFLTTGLIIYALKKKIHYRIIPFYDVFLLFLKLVSLHGLFIIRFRMTIANPQLMSISNLQPGVWIVYGMDITNTLVYFTMIIYYFYKDYQPNRRLVLVGQWDWTQDIWSDKLEYRDKDNYTSKQRATGAIRTPLSSNP